MSSTGLGMPITYYIHHTYNYDGCISRSVHVLLTIQHYIMVLQY